MSLCSSAVLVPRSGGALHSGVWSGVSWQSLPGSLSGNPAQVGLPLSSTVSRQGRREIRGLLDYLSKESGFT